jgi:hypothetical protein
VNLINRRTVGLSVLLGILELGRRLVLLKLMGETRGQFMVTPDLEGRNR